MLNSAEHEILNAHLYENVKTNLLFKGSDKLIMFFAAHKCLNSTNYNYWHFNIYCNSWNFNIYEQEEFHPQLG